MATPKRMKELRKFGRDLERRETIYTAFCVAHAAYTAFNKRTQGDESEAINREAVALLHARNIALENLYRQLLRRPLQAPKAA
jgi:hypothetical protein